MIGCVYFLGKVFGRCRAACGLHCYVTSIKRSHRFELLLLFVGYVVFFFKLVLKKGPFACHYCRRHSLRSNHGPKSMVLSAVSTVSTTSALSWGCGPRSRVRATFPSPTREPRILDCVVKLHKDRGFTALLGPDALTIPIILAAHVPLAEIRQKRIVLAGSIWRLYKPLTRAHDFQHTFICHLFLFLGFALGSRWLLAFLSCSVLFWLCSASRLTRALAVLRTHRFVDT
jgi:hypothetical protein